MSISNRHTVVPFVAGKTTAMVDQRLAKVGYKTTKKTPAAFPNVAVSVPVITEFPIEIIERATPYIRAMFENAQDGIVRSIYESSGGTLKEVADTDISLESCLAFMEAEENGSRLKKETIELWFDVSLSEIVTVAIAEKLKFDVTGELNADQRKTVKPHCDAVKDILSTLAGGKTMLTEKRIAGCRFYLALADNDDDMAIRLNGRLDAMEKKIAEENAKDAKMEELLGL